MSATMAQTGKFLPISEYRRLFDGSLESRLESMRKVLETGCSSFLGSAPVTVIATRDDGGVVYAKEGFHRVMVSAVDSGEQYVSAVSPLKVDTFEASTRDAYLMREANRAVDLFMRGLMPRAFEVVDDLAILVDSDPTRAAVSRVAVVETVMSLPRKWRQTLEERREQFQGLPESELHLDSGKYRELYEGGESPVAHAAAIRADLSAVMRLLSEMTSEVAAASQTMQLADDDSAALPHAVAFAEDLLEDLRSVEEHAKRAESSVCLVEYLGKLRDVVVEALPDYQLAVAFVKTVAGRLAEV